MSKRSAGQLLGWLSLRRRVLEDLQRRAEWAAEARTAPTVRAWLNARSARPADEPAHPAEPADPAGNRRPA
jgi:hypothetical protein